MPFINDKLKSFHQKTGNDPNGSLEEDLIPLQENKSIVSRYTFNYHNVVECLHRFIFGQEEAVKLMENMLKVVKSGISDPDKPLYVGLFVGPTGVGKTEIVRVLAKAIHGNLNAFCRIDMNTLSLEHYSAALTGAPPGYVGSKEGATIFNKELIEGSYSKPGIVLFDELEKANNQVIQTLLNILDNGILKISSGNETISFRNTIILMTSNVGARQIYRYLDNPGLFFLKRIKYQISGKAEKTFLEYIVYHNLEKRFEPEFINRIDDIAVFNRIKKSVSPLLVNKLQDDFNQRLTPYKCKVCLDEKAIDYITNKGYDKKFGARALKRAFRKLIEEPIAHILLDKNMENMPQVINITKNIREDKLCFKGEAAIVLRQS